MSRLFYKIKIEPGCSTHVENVVNEMAILAKKYNCEVESVFNNHQFLIDREMIEDYTEKKIVKILLEKYWK